MPKQSARQYYDELSDLVFSEKGSSKRADKLFNILDGLGYPSDTIMNAIDSGNKLPGKEKFKKGGYIKRQSGGQIGKPRGWGAARYGIK